MRGGGKADGKKDTSEEITFVLQQSFAAFTVSLHWAKQISAFFSCIHLNFACYYPDLLKNKERLREIKNVFEMTLMTVREMKFRPPHLCSYLIHAKESLFSAVI